MLSVTAPRLRIALVAVKAAERYAAEKRQFQGGSDAVCEEVASSPLWFDDTEESQTTHERHVRSPAYRELHRPALPNAAMGLYGGEPGFEKAHRVWVDPDRPHMKHIYNQTALARNLRYARYGYFKRDMHLLDVDKLVRHARLLPTPGRLLTDFLYQRVPLPDKSCAALIRYQRRQIEILEAWRRHASFECAAEMFERMVVTNIPPVEVGVETHAEMVLCAAACSKWEEGWNVYALRARELEEESPGSFVLDTRFFDALLTLCVAAGKVREGVETLEEVITRNLRPRATMLDKVMTLCSFFGERVSKVEVSQPLNKGGQPQQCELEEVEQFGLDAWSLFDFYQLTRTTASIEAYMRMCCAFNKPTLVLRAQGLSDASGIRLSIECFHWLVYAVRWVNGFGDYIMDLLSQLRPRGLTPDFVLFTLSFMYCALQRDGKLAVAIFDQHFCHQNMNPTPEMVLLFIQACAHCEEPSPTMLERAEVLMRRLEEVGSSVDLILFIYDQFLELCAQLGAIASGFSALKRIVGFGKPLTTRMINSLLLANANAASPNGSLAMTDELVGFFTLLKIRPNADTLICAKLCRDAFGGSTVVNNFVDTIAESLQRDLEGDVMPLYDEDIPVVQAAPHELRQLRAEWNLDPRDTMLRRYGQHIRPPGKATLDVGNMRGSVVPFGRSPGERMV